MLPGLVKGKLKTLLHILIFLVAILVIWTGLFFGLQVNTTYGNILLVAGVVIVVLNVFWMVRSERRKSPRR